MRFCLNILANCSNSSKSVDSSGGKSNLGGCPYYRKKYLEKLYNETFWVIFKDCVLIPL